jgi:hydroxypyruvate isomerase
MPRGRKPGYKHSDETKAKMREAKLGKTRSEEDKAAISQARRHSDLEARCMQRFLEMRAEYPGCEDFFDSNKAKLLFAMRDIKSEKELRDIRKYIETTHLEDVPQVCLQYQYDSTSIYEQERAMVDLIDAANFLRKTLSTKDENLLLH